MSAEIRARLEAIATGKAKPTLPSELDVNDVKAGQPVFTAWARFVRAEDGEPLSPPAEVLAPLP